MTPHVLPALLATQEGDLISQLDLVRHWNTPIHLDVMDGRFVPSTSVVTPQHLAAYPTQTFELHLMVENPIGVLESWSQHLNSIERVLVHIETDRPIGALLEWIQEHAHLKKTLVVNPETPVEAIRGHLKTVDEVMCMGVHPGASRQTFLGKSILEKIEWLHREYPQLTIGVDGGLNTETLTLCAQVGATRFRIGSSIFRAPDPFSSFEELADLARRTVQQRVY